MRALQVAVFALVSVIGLQAQTNGKREECDSLIDVGALLNFGDNFYLFYNKTVAKVSGFRNGLPIVEGEMTDPKLLWPQLDSTSPFAAFSFGSKVYFFLYTNEVQVFNGFSFIEKKPIPLVFTVFNPQNKASLKNYVLLKMISATVMKSPESEALITLLAQQFYQITNKWYYVEQLYLDKDFKNKTTLPNNLPKASDTSVAKPQFAPRALGSIGFNGTTNRMVVFYQSFWFFTDFTVNLKQRNIFDFSRTQDYRLSNHWLGCPQLFCFEADIDATTRSSDGSVLIFRGNYLWKTKEWTSSHELPQPRKVSKIWPQVGGYIDAAFSYGSSFYLIKEKDVFKISSSESLEETQKVTELFTELGDKLIYAATDFGLKLLLFSDLHVYVYHKSILEKSGQTISPAKYDFDSIDAALPLDVDTFYAFKGSFHFQVNLKKSGPIQPILSQRRLFSCSDDFYKQIKLNELLEITTFDSFSAYKSQNKPKPIVVKDIDLPTTQGPTNDPSGTGSVSTSPWYTWAFVVLGIVAFVVILSVVMFLFMRRKKKKVTKEKPKPIPVPEAPAAPEDKAPEAPEDKASEVTKPADEHIPKTKPQRSRARDKMVIPELHRKH